jgi:hypothetical protein
MDILKDQWSPALYIEALLVSIFSLLDSSNTNDPLMPDIARQHAWNRAAFESTARDRIKKYATREIIYPGTRGDGLLNTALAPCEEPKRELVSGRMGID